MPQFTPVSVTDVGALSLLTQYFSDRESSFPAAQGAYRTTFPSPEQFVPPRGVFLLVSDDASGAHGAVGAVGAVDPTVRYVGCGGIRRIEDGADMSVRYEIKHLFLLPEARGRGWGRDLLAELERRAKEFGATEVVLDTNSSLEAAGALYTRSGYEDVPPYNDNPNATNWYRKQLD